MQRARRVTIELSFARLVFGRFSKVLRSANNGPDVELFRRQDREMILTSAASSMFRRANAVVTFWLAAWSSAQANSYIKSKHPGCLAGPFPGRRPRSQSRQVNLPTRPASRKSCASLWCGQVHYGAIQISAGELCRPQGRSNRQSRLRANRQASGGRPVAGSRASKFGETGCTCLRGMPAQGAPRWSRSHVESAL